MIARGFPNIPQDSLPDVDTSCRGDELAKGHADGVELLVMNDLTPSYVPETGQVILSASPPGPAGEARLIPVKGVELAFDRVDGHLVRVLVGDDSAPVAALLTRLFGPQAPGLIRDAAEPTEVETRVLSPEPELCAALSSLARLAAARITSPVRGSSPWWAVETAVLAERAGLHTLALAEAQRAVRAFGSGQLVVPDLAATTAREAAHIAAAVDPDAARRLKDSIVVTSQPYEPSTPGLDVAAEVEGLEKDSVRLPGLHWVLDPDLVPTGLFRPGLSPHSDLFVHHDHSGGRVLVEVTLVSGADCLAVGQCRARLVDPALGRVLAQASFDSAGSRPRVELRLPFSLDELGETWIDVLDGKDRPVRSARGHRNQRALRWADAALRAERAPVGLAAQSTGEDWAALAAVAWERCRLDWEVIGDLGQAAAVRDPRVSLPEPACLAEIIGE